MTAIRHKDSHEQTSYFPDSNKLIRAFNCYVYYKYDGLVSVEEASSHFLRQIDSSVIDLNSLPRDVIKEFIVVLYSVIEAFDKITAIRFENLNGVKLDF